MIVYPAIDMRGGKVVRLRKGDPQRQTVFSDDPVDTARRWLERGAEWIHMVNLDGSLDDAGHNLSALETAANLDVKLQYTGGLRDLDAMGRALDAGASRVAIGTLAVREPETAVEAVERFGGEAVCVALDAKDGKITTHGWTEASTLDPITFGKWLRERGAKHALFTDVARDGMLSGVNLDATVALARQTGLHVIASGGVRDVNDIRRLAASGVVAGVVVGMALYQNRFSLEAALDAAKAGQPC